MGTPDNVVAPDATIQSRAGRQTRPDRALLEAILLANDVLVTGTVDVAVTWTTDTRLADLVVEGTALLESQWLPGPTRFTAVRRHPFNHDGLTNHHPHDRTTS